MGNERPKQIKIMADHAFAYCWNMSNDGAMLLEEFYAYAPQVEAIAKELEAWQEWFERDSDYMEEASMPWDEFHEQGVALARRLAAVLAPFGVEVYYDRPGDDPKGMKSEPFRVG